ncbi:MAG: hypothetical protein V7K50_16055 [Nostoc sp.]|uniref:hypothetical protein n=1 Tax=Nostoc sp. TaxID=1180 RepID=UPI002FF535E6
MGEIFLLTREIVKVIFHLNGGYTRVVWERSENTAWASKGWIFDIPTHVIPYDLRAIGSRFLLSIVKSNANDCEDIENIRNNRNSFFHIERLPFII